MTSSPWASGAPGCSTDRRQNAGHGKTILPGGGGARQRHSGGLYPAGKARGADPAGAGRAAGQPLAREALLETEINGRTVVFDLMDGYFYNDPAAVLALFQRADVVFKRSFSEEKNRQFPGDISAKLRPLGLNYYVTCPGSPLEAERSAKSRLKQWALSTRCYPQDFEARLTRVRKKPQGEANVPFFSMSGSEFVEMFVGMGASKVRDLFKQANEKAPCIVFIDEIDTIGKKRDNAGYGGNDEREQTLNQLLTEMDGFDASKGVVILAATNRPDSLDPALLRPGRFDRRIPVELPDLKGREEILKVHAKKVRLGDDIDFNAIARAASGASGAELANMVNEAALRAVRDNRKFVTQADLEESIETVIAGYQKKNQVLSAKEKLIVSYHEIGHALVAALQTHSAPVTKITIIPRTSGALGYTMQVEAEERNLMSKEELVNKIATLTGGRCAEKLIFDSITTGASNDIEQATKLTRAMITRYGMSDRFGMVALETQNNPYLGGDSTLSCSPQTAATIDDMVVETVREGYDTAMDLLEKNKMKLHELAKYLYEKETITGEEFMQILNRKEISGEQIKTESED